MVGGTCESRPETRFLLFYLFTIINTASPRDLRTTVAENFVTAIVEFDSSRFQRERVESASRWSRVAIARIVWSRVETARYTTDGSKGRSKRKMFEHGRCSRNNRGYRLRETFFFFSFRYLFIFFFFFRFFLLLRMVKWQSWRFSDARFFFSSGKEAKHRDDSEEIGKVVVVVVVASHRIESNRAPIGLPIRFPWLPKKKNARSAFSLPLFLTSCFYSRPRIPFDFNRQLCTLYARVFQLGNKYIRRRKECECIWKMRLFR